MDGLARCNGSTALADRLPLANLPQLSRYALQRLVRIFRLFADEYDSCIVSDSERYASQAIVFYASFLQDAVGPSFAFPSLEYLADYWLDKSCTSLCRVRIARTRADLRRLSQLKFNRLLARSSAPIWRRARMQGSWHSWKGGKIYVSFSSGRAAWIERAKLTTSLRRQSHRDPSRTKTLAVARIKLYWLSVLLPLSDTSSCRPRESTSLTAASSTLTLRPFRSVLKDLSLSIVSYLDDDLHPYHQAIATELCSRGFGIWQNYVDAMLLVRQLFGLATGRNPSTPNELRNLARLATLHVAGVNTPLFMTTLLWDILNAPSATHRNATLKLLGFMIRKVRSY